MKTITRKEYCNITNCSPWLNIDHFEIEEAQEFLNRKGYDIIIHRAMANVQPMQSVAGTGEVEKVGPRIDKMVERVLAVKQGSILPPVFTEEVMNEMGFNNVFQRELRKNLLA